MAKSRGQLSGKFDIILIGFTVNQDEWAGMAECIHGGKLIFITLHKVVFAIFAADNDFKV